MRRFRLVLQLDLDSWFFGWIGSCYFKKKVKSRSWLILDLLGFLDNWIIGFWIIGHLVFLRIWIFFRLMFVTTSINFWNKDTPGTMPAQEHLCSIFSLLNLRSYAYNDSFSEVFFHCKIILPGYFYGKKKLPPFSGSKFFRINKHRCWFFRICVFLNRLILKTLINTLLRFSLVYFLDIGFKGVGISAIWFLCWIWIKKVEVDWYWIYWFFWIIGYLVLKRNLDTTGSMFHLTSINFWHKDICADKPEQEHYCSFFNFQFLLWLK